MVWYKFSRVKSIHKTTEPTNEYYGYVCITGVLGDKCYPIDKDTYARIAIPLLFERFKGWQKVIHDFDGLTVQLDVEIVRAGLRPEKEYDHETPDHFGVSR
jgi:hypothetical protein